MRAKQLRKNDYVVTELRAVGHHEVPVEVTLIFERRRDIPELLQLIKEIDPQAFYTVMDVKKMHQAIFLRPGKPMIPTGWRAILKKK